MWVNNDIFHLSDFFECFIQSVLPYSEPVSFTAPEPQYMSRTWVRERDSHLTQWKNAYSCKGMIPQRLEEASDTLLSPVIGFGFHTHQYNSGISKSCWSMCVSWEMEEERGLYLTLSEKAVWHADYIKVDRTDRVDHESYGNLTIYCSMQFTIYWKVLCI